MTTGEVMVFLGKHFVVTVRHGDHGGLAALRRDLEADPARLAKGPSVVLHAVADRVVDNYLVGGRLGPGRHRRDRDRRSSPPTRTRDTARIYHLKREVLELKRAIHPLHLPLRALAERPIDVVHPKVREYFRDVEDHLHRASDQVLVVRRTAHVDPAGEPGAAVGRRERGHAADHRLGRDHRRGDRDRRDLRHELRLHARAQWRFGYPLVLVVIGRSAGSSTAASSGAGWL